MCQRRVNYPSSIIGLSVVLEGTRDLSRKAADGMHAPLGNFRDCTLRNAVFGVSETGEAVFYPWITALVIFEKPYDNGHFLNYHTVVREIAKSFSSAC